MLISSSVAQSCPTPWDLVGASLLCPWDFPVRILEWVAISSWRDLPTQRLNPRLLRCRLILYQLSHQGSLLLEFKDTASCYNRIPQILITHQAAVFEASHEVQLSIFLQSLWPGLIDAIPISLSTSCSLGINSLLVKITKWVSLQPKTTPSHSHCNQIILTCLCSSWSFF